MQATVGRVKSHSMAPCVDNTYEKLVTEHAHNALSYADISWEK